MNPSNVEAIVTHIFKSGKLIEPIPKRHELSDLLNQQPALFLRKYGTLLTEEELKKFEYANGDFEVSMYLKRLNTRLKLNAKNDQLNKNQKTENIHQKNHNKKKSPL